MTAALALAEQGFDAYLVEKEKELGGHLRHVRYMLNGEDPQDELQNAKAQVFKNQRIHLFTGATIEGVEGTIGDFRTNVSGQWQKIGAQARCGHRRHRRQQYEPKEYLYGQDERVLTQRELEQRLSGWRRLPRDMR